MKFRPIVFGLSWGLSWSLLCLWGAGRAGAAELFRHSISEKMDGPDSPYTARLLEMIGSWPSKGLTSPPSDPNPVRMTCLRTEGNDFYIGLEQSMRVRAPLDSVESVLDDFNHYKELFPGYDDVHEVSREGNRFIIFWEQHVPLFFVPNVKYELTYLVDKSSRDRAIYRYKLKQSKNLKYDDGIIVAERDGSGTRYMEYDFYDADWGIAKTLAPGRIWKDSVEGIYLSDVAIQLKAEHPDWSYRKIAEEGRKLLDRFPVDPCLDHKKLFR